MPAPPELLTPTSPAEAAAAFGDGSDVTVMAGGTILLPELTYGRLRPARVLMLGRAGLSGVDNSNGVVRIGAGTPVGDLRMLRSRSRPRPARSPTARFARSGRSGGTCARPPARRPRGEISRRRCSRSARASPRSGRAARRPRTSRSSSMSRAGRLVLFIDVPGGQPSGYARLDRPHTHHYTMLAVSAVRRSDGVRLAASGVGTTRRRLSRSRVGPRRRRARRPRPPRTRPKGWSFRPTPWRRPGTESKCCRCSSSARSDNSPEGDADAPRRQRPPARDPRRGLTSLLRVLREELFILSPKAGCEQGGCGACTVLIDGEPRRSCLTPIAASTAPR